MLPLAQHEVHYLSGRQPEITYGKLSKVASPKEAREKAKQAMEKSKSDAKSTVDAEDQETDSVLVRVKCHLENLEDQASFQRGELHSGRLWVSHELCHVLPLRYCSGGLHGLASIVCLCVLYS